MLFSYGFIILKVRKSQVRSSICVSNGKNKLRASSKSIKDRKRITCMCISLVVTFTLCWTMYHATHLAKLFGIKILEGDVNLFFNNPNCDENLYLCCY